jgi:hypothetical protein
MFFLGEVTGVFFVRFGVALWCSGMADAGGRRAESREPMTDGLSTEIFCSFPMFAVRSLIWKGDDGGLKDQVRCSRFGEATEAASTKEEDQQCQFGPCCSLCVPQGPFWKNGM